MASLVTRLWLAITIVAVTAFADVMFDFETTPQGTTTPFSATWGSVTATFTSQDGNVFSVADAMGLFRTLAGNVVWDPGFTPYTLDIVFSQPMKAITMTFALAGLPATSILYMDLYAGGIGGVHVESAAVMGGPAPPGSFPEGVVSASVSNWMFDAVRLATNAESIAIDNVSVLPLAQIPEPSSVVLTVGGLFASLTLARAGVGLRRERSV